ncbi:MAG TPA: hypothetical protein ENI23_16740 [bacterium]|nr:hypothetical protein [bacterium]
MSEYMASCKYCGKSFRFMSTISDRNKPVECECGSMAKRDLKVEFAPRGVRHKWVSENERWSRSMGVPPSQVATFRKRFPNSIYRDDGRLLIKSRSDKLRQCKERDMCELD